MKNFIKEIFSGKNMRLSSKRVIGFICIAYAILITLIAFIVSSTTDIPLNVLETAKYFMGSGVVLIGVGTFEKKEQ